MDEHTFIQYLPQMIGAVCVLSFNIYRYYFRREEAEEPPVEPETHRRRQDSLYNRLYSLLRKNEEEKTNN